MVIEVSKPKTNTFIADGLIKRTSSMLDEIDSKTVHHIKTKKVMDRGKRSKTLTEVKPVKNISKNLLNLLEISPVQKEVLPLHLNWKTIAYKSKK